ncbi:MAG TPA: SMI1/KNR4 family protein [Chitinophaga sp.]|uniref:SMI1/KNR4 family protein n=1 Tax=Chitinophaga sp. TaxID=1869181 RepID=UPI002B736D46|nr:SMI1/KNR4 family protein [Chitinophaga sp.]HVI43705.1 SMI1/KNR4 family protein [Chitinophaga sp.]
MLKHLETLDTQLSALRPSYYSQLAPALTGDAIQALEKKYATTLPSDVRQLYLWKNGQQPNCYEAFVNNSLFVSLEEMLDTAQELTSMIGSDFDVDNWWNAGWLPLFHNGGGSRICYDMNGIFTARKGQLIEYWNADSDRNVISPDLDTFLASLSQYYATTPPEAFDEFFIIDPPQGFPERFIAG